MPAGDLPIIMLLNVFFSANPKDKCSKSASTGNLSRSRQCGLEAIRHTEIQLRYARSQAILQRHFLSDVTQRNDVMTR